MMVIFKTKTCIGTAILSWLIEQNESLGASLRALAQVNTGFFTVSIALLTIVPSLIELAKEHSDGFVSEELSMEQLDDSLRLFRISTVIIGTNAVLAATMSIYPTALGTIIVILLTLAGSILLGFGGKNVSSITQDAL